MSSNSSTRVSPTALGITLLGVILSIGVSVGFGIDAPWWARAGAGVATVLVLGALVKTLTHGGHGRLSRFADWLVGGSGGDNGDSSS